MEVTKHQLHPELESKRLAAFGLLLAEEIADVLLVADRSLTRHSAVCVVRD